VCELIVFAAVLCLSAAEAPRPPVASLSGAKGNITYVVASSTPAHLPQATEIAIDLAELLAEPDPELGNRRPLELVDPVLTAWMPGDGAARETQMMWPGKQAGQYRAHVVFSGSGFGTLRVDGKKTDGGQFAVLLPLAVGAPKQKSTPARMFAMGKNEPTVGFAQLGKITYNRTCACCHGKDVYGSASKEDDEGRGAPRFHSAEFMLSLNEEQLLKAALVDELDRADLLAYLAPYRPNLKNVEPAATRYVYREHAIDDETRTLIRRSIGKPVTTKSVALFALYKDPKSADAGATKKPLFVVHTAQRVSEDARDLDTARPPLRVGYFAVVHGMSKDPVEELWLLLDNDLKVKRLLARDDASRPATTPSKDALAAFERGGGRDELLVPKPDRVEKGDTLAQQVAAAYLSVKAAVRAYEKDEADRAALP
jgi:hypothetical protein